MTSNLTNAEREKLASVMESSEKLLWCNRPIATGLINGSFIFSVLWILSIIDFASILDHHGELQGGILIMLFIFLLIGIGFMTIGSVVYRKNKNKEFYALTDRRALVFNYDKTRQYPVREFMALCYRKRKNAGDIILGEEKDDETTTSYGFMRITDADKVLTILQTLSDGKALHSDMPAELRRQERDRGRHERYLTSAQHLRTFIILQLIGAAALSAELIYFLPDLNRTPIDFPLFCLSITILFNIIPLSGILCAIRGRKLMKQNLHSADKAAP